ncbi:MAG: DUF4097 family beta strand repeat-containing protein [Melioribacteraceae bacterium]|nr:DUF4097 family beta strand repeat-containing protein [Melioribacteraceae bacterium]
MKKLIIAILLIPMLFIFAQDAGTTKNLIPPAPPKPAKGLNSGMVKPVKAPKVPARLDKIDKADLDSEAEFDSDEGILNKTFTVGKGGKLTVNVSPGELTIKTWNQNSVEIKADGFDKRDIDNIEIVQTGNDIKIKYESEFGWGGDGDFVITVPEEYNLNLRTTSGDLEIKGNLIGFAKVSTMGGDISVKDIKGNADLSTQGGDIRTGDLDGVIMLNTMGGDIQTGKLNGKDAQIYTMGGEINIKSSSSDVKTKTYGGDIQIGDVGGTVDLVTYGGNIKVNTVGGSAILETYGGNLFLNGAKGEVLAKTSGGNINLKNISGSVQARTMAGDISVQLNPSGSKSYISTNTGEIELILPADAKATVEAIIKVNGWWKNMKDDYKIYSDFDVTTVLKVGDDEEEENEDNNEIRSVFQINGGGSKITLKSINSDISIRKSNK